jgi:hypothetical protein
MDLAQKFEATCSTNVISIGSLDEGLNYPILLAARATTRYGPSIVLTLRDDEEATATKVFPPCRYYSIFSDTNIADINSQKKRYYLVYKGQNEKTKDFDIVIKKNLMCKKRCICVNRNGSADPLCGGHIVSTNNDQSDGHCFKIVISNILFYVSSPSFFYRVQTEQ